MTQQIQSKKKFTYYPNDLTAAVSQFKVIRLGEVVFQKVIIGDINCPIHVFLLFCHPVKPGEDLQYFLIDFFHNEGSFKGLFQGFKIFCKCVKSVQFPSNSLGKWSPHQFVEGDQSVFKVFGCTKYCLPFIDLVFLKILFEKE